MGLIKKENQGAGIRDAPERRTDQMLEVDGTLESMFRGIAGNRTVTRDDAMGIPALAGCLEFICGIAASLPIKLYQTGPEKEQEITDDSRLYILNEETGDLLTGSEWKKAFFIDYLLRGRAWAYLNMNLNRLESLHYVDDQSVSVSMNEDPIFKTAVVWVQGSAHQPYEFIHMARNTRTGVRGEGLLNTNQVLFEMALNYIEFENAIVKGGGNKRGFLQSDHRLDNDRLTELKTAFEKMYGNSRDGVIVLNKGVNFTPASATSVEMQLAENKDRNREEICSLFCLPVSIITGKATLEEFTQAIKVAVVPLLKNFETAVNRAVLLESEKGTLRFDCSAGDLENGDMLKRFQAYTEACKAGWLSKNEIRYREKYKPIEGLDVVSMSLGDVIYDITAKKFYVPNTGESVEMAIVGGGAEEGGDNCEN